MKYGLAVFPTAEAIHPAELAEAAEARGFESLWVAEHTHIPANRVSPFPGGGELPRVYYEAMDPFVALTAAATATSTLKVATGICLVVQRDPIVTAKQVASLDTLSGGRFLFGIGAGWNAEEMANHGTTDFAGRFKLMRERVEAMKAIWADDPAGYHGDLVDFDPIWSKPKPIQRPHPPIHVGGAAPQGARRAARYGDGWIPIGFGGDFLDQVGALDTEAARFGRNRSEIEVSCYGAPDEFEELARYRDHGISRAVFRIPSSGSDVIIPVLDELATLADRVG